MNTAMLIRRGFVDVAGGQMHYRTAGEAGPRPLVMFHASPGSSLGLEPMIRRFAASRQVIAIDTLGNGDSAPPTEVRPDLAVFVRAHLAAIEALGLADFDVYGSHTGGNIGCEITIALPGRVRHLILDGMSLYCATERADMLENYAPPVAARTDGGHLLHVWNFVRDTYLFWPWYRRDAAHRRAVGLPSADALHDKVVEVLKALRTFHLSYNAAIAYDKSARLPLIRVPTLLACAQGDMLLPYLDEVAKLMPQAQTWVTPGVSTEVAAETTVSGMTRFLDGRPPGATT